MVTPFCRLVVPLVLWSFVGLAPKHSCAADSMGIYLGAGVGRTLYDSAFGEQLRNAYNGSAFTVVDANTTRRHDVGYKAFAGYRFAGPFALELSYVDLGEPRAHYAFRPTTGLINQNLYTRESTYRIRGVNLAGVGTLPITDKLSARATVGAFYSQLDYSEQGRQTSGDVYTFAAPTLRQTNLSYGLGVAYRFAAQWSVRGDWDRFRNVGQSFKLTVDDNGRFANIDLFSVNIEYHFR